MISIIVVTRNEAQRIEHLLNTLLQMRGNKEIIVVDGGSSDATYNIVARYPLKRLCAMGGRGAQLHAGALAASGDYLWFVHADSRPDPNALAAIERAMQEDDYVGGFFKLYFFDDQRFLVRALALTSHWRARFLQLIFGDQGLFVKRGLYLSMGGFKAMPIMEDWEFSRRLYQCGKVAALKMPIGTSARRFQKAGFCKALLQMHYIKLLYILGVNPQKIAKIYREIR